MKAFAVIAIALLAMAGEYSDTVLHKYLCTRHAEKAVSSVSTAALLARARLITVQ